MTFTVSQDAHAVILPAFDTLTFLDVMEPFLKGGGQSVLVGESRGEYVARKMSAERLASETASSFQDVLSQLRSLQPNLIVAVDQELAGIQRLEGLTPALPSVSEALRMQDEELVAACQACAAGARGLGVTMFLAPIADVVTGRNPWLDRRTLGKDPAEVARLVSAFVTGVQREGIVTATKHFPGFIDIALDPALVDVVSDAPLHDILGNSSPFKAAIAAGTGAVMVGPAALAAIDPVEPACTSAAVISLLKQEFQFQGLVVSDDLDAPATMRGRSLSDTAIASLNAGADLLLVAGGKTLGELITAIEDGVNDGRLPKARLQDAASKVRAMASIKSAI